jgi:hypothetical protein
VKPPLTPPIDKFPSPLPLSPGGEGKRERGLYPRERIKVRGMMWRKSECGIIEIKGLQLT